MTRWQLVVLVVALMALILAGLAPVEPSPAPALELAPHFTDRD